MSRAAAVEMNRQGGSGRLCLRREKQPGVAQASSVTWEDHDRLFPRGLAGHLPLRLLLCVGMEEAPL